MIHKNVFLHKDGVRIRDMKQDGVRDAHKPSSLNVSRVMSHMLPSCDVDLMCNRIVEAVRLSERLGENDAELSSRIYNAMMAESNQEDY